MGYEDRNDEGPGWRYWILDAGSSMPDTRCWMLDAGYSMLVVGYCLLEM
jgi:hypothetical protein